MKHTPGPWKAMSACDDGACVTTKDGREDVAVDCTKADAKLIAAAPDMLEALQKIQKMANDLNGGADWSEVLPSDNGLDDWMGNVADKAIVTATGVGQQ